MTIVVLRVVAHRAWCVYRRRAGYPPVNSRTEGVALLGMFLPRIPALAMRWIEPVLVMVMVVAAVPSVISSPLGGYLMSSSLGLLGITVVRASMSYNKMLDKIDAEVQPELPVARTSDRMLFSQMGEAQLLEA
jgi:hypothetical protein